MSLDVHVRTDGLLFCYLRAEATEIHSYRTSTEGTGCQQFVISTELNCKLQPSELLTDLPLRSGSVSAAERVTHYPQDR